MSPKDRQKKLVEYLEIIDEWSTVKDLADVLGVSERTLHSDINTVNKNIKDTGSMIEKKRGVGIKLINHITINDKDNKQEYEQINDRKIQILEMLLIKNMTVTYNDLANELFVSSTSIKNDIDEIKTSLNANTRVKIISDLNGTKITGDENSIREAMIWFNQKVIEKKSLAHYNNMDQIKKVFEEFYQEELVNVAYDILFSFVMNNNSLLSEYYILNTLNVYIVQLHRLVNENLMDQSIMNLTEDDFGDLSDFTSGSSQLLKRASSRLTLEYTQNDIKFLAKYLILNRFEHIPNETTNINFIEGLISYLSDAFGVNFKKDSQLMKELKQHVPPMIYRLKLKVRVENPFTEQIKSEYRETFHTISMAISKFESGLKVEFNDGEVALLAIYFQSAIERQKEHKRILVVCQYGIATSELLVNKLKNELSAAEQIESTSVGELEYYNLDDYELIVSSTNLIKGKNVINVSPLLTNQDIEYIKRKLNSNGEESVEETVDIENIKKFLNKDYIFINAEFNDRESLVAYIDNKLTSDEYIENSYTETLIRRESLGNTDLPNGVATPHGDIDLVNKSLMVIINNNKKIRWNKYFVDKIFILLISKEDTKETKDIMKELYSLINDKNIMSHFKEYLNEVKGDSIK